MSSVHRWWERVTGLPSLGGQVSDRGGNAGKMGIELAKRLRSLQIVEADGSDPRQALTRAQRSVVADLARGRSVPESAARAKTHPERITRWLTMPRFQRALLKEEASPMTWAQTNGDWNDEEQSDAH